MYTESRVPLPLTSLIICSRNRPGLLADSVASILRGDEVPTELLIIDQSNQPDATLEALKTERPCELRYIWTRSVGLSRANNLGVSLSHYDVLVFTHDDVLVPPEWFGLLVRALLAAGHRSIVTGQVRAHGEQPGGFQLAIKIDEHPVFYERPGDTDVLYPLNMAMYKSMIYQTKGFDVRLGPGTPFPGAEDSDFGYRLLMAGYRIVYVPEAMLYHRAWRPSSDYVPLRWAYGVGRGGFYAKHLSLRNRYTLRRMIQDVRIHLVQSLHNMQHDQRRAWGDAALAGGILFGAMKWMLTQRKRNEFTF